MATKDFTLSALTSAIAALDTYYRDLSSRPNYAGTISSVCSLLGFIPVVGWIPAFLGLEFTNQDAFANATKIKILEAQTRMQAAKIYLLENPRMYTATIAHDTESFTYQGVTLTLPCNIRVQKYCDGNGFCIF